MAVASSLVLSLSLGGSPVGAEVTYRPPVDAPITDGFRLPEHPWLPGNRGLEYATVPNQEIVAAADGLVTFAGPVANGLHVTVSHADRTLTSYSFVARVTVAAGDRVVRGQPVAVSGRGFHFGARRDGGYIDPETLWGGPVTVHLVDDDGQPVLERGSPGRPGDGMRKANRLRRLSW